jgi:hypothetical protein
VEERNIKMNYSTKHAISMNVHLHGWTAIEHYWYALTQQLNHGKTGTLLPEFNLLPMFKRLHI